MFHSCMITLSKFTPSKKKNSKYSSTKLKSPRCSRKKMIPIMYNTCYGGFSLSEAAITEYNRRKSPDTPRLDAMGRDIDRTDPLMIQIFREIGKQANGMCADIRLDHIPPQYKNNYYIQEYDGTETVRIDYKGYLLDEIQKIMRDPSISSEDKVSRMDLLDWSIVDSDFME